MLPPQYVIFSLRGIPPWQIPPDQWDLLLVRNYPAYLVEGKAGLGVVLGETRNQLRKMWGSPYRRNYGIPESLFYKNDKFTGHFLIRGGRIIQIRYAVNNEESNPITWFTALGLRQEDTKGKSVEDIIKKILDFYPETLYVKLPNELIIQTRGIHFLFDGKQIREIRIFTPHWG